MEGIILPPLCVDSGSRIIRYPQDTDGFIGFVQIHHWAMEHQELARHGPHLDAIPTGYLEIPVSEILSFEVMGPAPKFEVF